MSAFTKGGYYPDTSISPSNSKPRLAGETKFVIYRNFIPQTVIGYQGL